MPALQRAGQRRRRRRVEPEVAVRVVLDQRQARGLGGRGERGAARLADAAPARVLEVRQHVQEARAGRRGRARRATDRRRRTASRRPPARTARTPAARRGRSATRPRRGLPASISTLPTRSRPCCEPVVISTCAASTRRPCSAMCPATHSRSGAVALARGVLQRLARRIAQHALARRAHRLDRKAVGRRQAAGERDHARLLGQLQDLADHRRIHPLGALRQRPGSGHAGLLSTA